MCHGGLVGTDLRKNRNNQTSRQSTGVTTEEARQSRSRFENAYFQRYEGMDLESSREHFVCQRFTTGRIGRHEL